MLRELVEQNGALRPPTAINFDPAAWDKFVQGLSSATRDDWRIYSAALWIGNRLRALRSAYIPLFKGMSSAAATSSTVGYANAAYFFDRRDFRKAIRAEVRRIGVSTAALGHTTISRDETGQQISEDHLVTTMVDAIPHALFHARRPPTELHSDDRTVEIADAFTFGNIEFVFRAVWQQVAWEGYWLRVEAGRVTLEPPTREYGSWWPVWDYRRQSLIIEQLTVEGYGFIPGFRQVDYSQQVPKRKVARVTAGNGRRIFKYQHVRPSSHEFQAYVAALIGLRESGLDVFLDRPISTLPGRELTFRALLSAWFSIEWLCEAVAKTFPARRADAGDLRRFAIGIDKSLLVEAVSSSAELSAEQSQAAIEFLTLDTANASAMFNRGAWANPLVRDPERSIYYFVFGVLVLGNVVRAFEHWIEQGGLASSGELKGSDFETRVVRILKETAAESELPVELRVAGPNIQFEAEEIDAALLVGDLLLVIEAKNFLTPGDPLDRYNVLKRIKRGASQAARKAEAVRKRLDEFVLSTGLSAGARVKQVLGVVVTANAYGVGLVVGGVPVVDLSYLSLLISSTEIATSMTAVRGKYVNVVEHLYQPFGFNTYRFVALLKRPFVQDKIFRAINWTYQPFPSGDPSVEFYLPFPFIGVGEDVNFARAVADRMK